MATIPCGCIPRLPDFIDGYDQISNKLKSQFEFCNNIFIIESTSFCTSDAIEMGEGRAHVPSDPLYHSKSSYRKKYH